MEKWGCLGQDEWFNSVNELQDWTPCRVRSAHQWGGICTPLAHAVGVSVLFHAGSTLGIPRGQTQGMTVPQSYVKRGADSQQTENAAVSVQGGVSGAKRLLGAGRGVLHVGRTCAGEGTGLCVRLVGVDVGPRRWQWGQGEGKWLWAEPATGTNVSVTFGWNF